MSDFFQTGAIATLHRLGTSDVPRMERELAELAPNVWATTLCSDSCALVFGDATFRFYPLTLRMKRLSTCYTVRCAVWNGDSIVDRSRRRFISARYPGGVQGFGNQRRYVP